MWGKMGIFGFLLFCCAYVHGQQCSDHFHCVDCLKDIQCVFLITQTGGICVGKREKVTFITKVRDHLSCKPVEGIIKEAIKATNETSSPSFLPEKQPLIAQENDDASVVSRNQGGPTSTNFIKNSTLGFDETRGMKIQLVVAQCNFYITLFQQLHPKSIKIDKEYGRCIRRAV